MNLICKIFGHDYPIITPYFALRADKDHLFKTKNTCCRCRILDEASYTSQLAKFETDVKLLMTSLSGGTL